MLIKFTDDYINYINAGYNLLAKLQLKIASEEPHIGAHQKLDVLYAECILTEGIIDLLSNDDNSVPKENEKFLQCLKSLLAKHHCPLKLNSIKFKNRYPLPAPLDDGHIVEDLTPVHITTHLGERILY